VSDDAWSLRPTMPEVPRPNCSARCSRRQGLRSSASADLRYVVPTTRTKLGERAVAGQTAWNSLPADIRRTTDTTAFKRQLATHYFNLAFNV